MWCPRCDQGFIVRAKVVKTGALLFGCQECEATWFNQEDIGRHGFLDFGTYMMQQGLSPLWDEISVL